MSKSLALFIPKLADGGAERVFVDYANGLVARGHRVTLVCLKGGVYERELNEQVRLVKLASLGCKRLRGALLPLIRVFRQIRPDAVICGLTVPNALGLIAARIARVPKVVLTVHNDLSSTDAVQEAVAGRFELWIMRRIYPYADRVVAVSKGVSDFLVNTVGLDPTCVSVVYNPVYKPGILEKAREPFPEKLALLSGAEFIVGAGRLVPQKGFDRLIKAFAKAFPAPSTVRLVILGEGRERKHLEHLAEAEGLLDRVFLPGFVENPYAVFGRAKAFVLSSRWEGFGNVLVEALASGTQIISFDCRSGPSEIIEAVDAGVLVPDGDVQSLAHSLEMLAFPVTGIPGVSRNRLAMFSVENAARQLDECTL